MTQCDGMKVHLDTTTPYTSVVVDFDSLTGTCGICNPNTGTYTGNLKDGQVTLSLTQMRNAIYSASTDNSSSSRSVAPPAMPEM